MSRDKSRLLKGEEDEEKEAKKKEEEEEEEKEKNKEKGGKEGRGEGWSRRQKRKEEDKEGRSSLDGTCLPTYVAAPANLRYFILVIVGNDVHAQRSFLVRQHDDVFVADAATADAEGPSTSGVGWRVGGGGGGRGREGGKGVRGRGGRRIGGGRGKEV